MSKNQLNGLLSDARLVRSLAAAGITTLTQLSQRTLIDLVKTKNIGPRSVRVLEALLAEHQMCFKPNPRPRLTGEESLDVKLAATIGQLGPLDGNIRQALWDAEIDTLGQLVAHTRRQLQSIRGLGGDARLNELEAALIGVGLRLATTAR